MDDLGADLREARGLRPQVVDYTNAGGGRDRRVEMVDEAAEERFIGAQERMKPIENELRSFVQANLSELPERAPRAREVTERAERALHLARAAPGEYEAERNW